MKTLFFVIMLLLGMAACNVKNNQPNNGKDSLECKVDSTHYDSIYSNEIFKDVTVTKLDSNRYTITGKGRIFEATFNWVIEDGHEELQQGYEMTSAGAPEWGTFEFTIEAQKKRENSTLMLILFEASAKDGHRMHELPIVLE